MWRPVELRPQLEFVAYGFWLPSPNYELYESQLYELCHADPISMEINVKSALDSDAQQSSRLWGVRGSKDSQLLSYRGQNQSFPTGRSGILRMGNFIY